MSEALMRRCGWPRCANEVPRAEWGCTRHGHLLPATLRERWTPAGFDFRLYNEIQDYIARYEYAQQTQLQLQRRGAG